MRIRTLLVALLALLWLSVTSGDLVAATKKAPAKPAPKTASVKKASAPASVKKSSVKKTTVKKVSTAKKKSKPVAAKSPVAKKARVVVPKRPPADLPPITEAASAWQGCLNRSEFPMLATELGIDEARLSSLLQDAGIPADSAVDCTPYVAAIGGLENSALAVFPTNQAALTEMPVLVVRKTAEGVTANQDKCECLDADGKVFTYPLQSDAKLPLEAADEIPANIRWITETLVPYMASVVSPDDQDGSAPASIDNQYSLRLVLNQGTDTHPQHLRSIEILETATGKRVDGAWWLDRGDGPGVLIGMNGLSYEQLLWQSPVAYEHKSRGVGPRYVTVKRKNKATGKVTTARVLSTKSYHYGIDMMAKKGTDVHAVADAKVAFVGRKSGFGNLIILDHGHGYTTYYAHLSKFDPETKLGATVSRGQLIGLVGSTGHSTAPHLHFEMRQNNNYIDPLDGTHQLDFWLLTPDDQQRLAMQILTPPASAPLLARAEE